MKRIIGTFSRIADAIAAGMLAAIFLIFLLQIGSRYMPRIMSGLGLEETFPTLAAIEPLGWTLELIGILWVWVIFFACAFVVREHDHVKFDIIYLAVSRRTRQIFFLIGALGIAAGMAWALIPTWEYVDFMRLRKTATVRWPLFDIGAIGLENGQKIPLRTIFSIYLAFMVMVALRYLWMFVDVLRNGPPKTELEVVLEAEAEAAASEGEAK